MHINTIHLISGRILLCCLTLLDTFDFILTLRTCARLVCWHLLCTRVVGWAVSCQVFHWQVSLIFFYQKKLGIWRKEVNPAIMSEIKGQRLSLPHVFIFLATEQWFLDRFLCSDLGINVLLWLYPIVIMPWSQNVKHPTAGNLTPPILQ